MPFKYPIPIPFPEIIFAKLNAVIKSRLWDPSHCWEWPEATTTFGYGMISHWDNLRKKQWQVSAHRASYCYHAGIISTGDLFVLHRCDNPPCWNWDHLYLGNASANNADMDARKRRATSPFKSTTFVKFIRGEMNHNAKVNSADIVLLRSMYEEGASTVFLGKRFCLDPSTIRKIVSGRAWAHVQTPRLKRLPKPGTSKLTDWDVIAIRESIKNGIRVSELANTFGVSPFTLYGIARGERWKHLLK